MMNVLLFRDPLISGFGMIVEFANALIEQLFSGLI